MLAGLALVMENEGGTVNVIETALRAGGTQSTFCIQP
jgi:hypothetical protein